MIHPLTPYPFCPNNDLWAMEHFEYKRQGFFVEVGAADGIEGSSCWMLECRGWRGICVEPSQEFFPMLIENRPDAICENVCVWSHDGFVDYTENRYLGGVREALEIRGITGGTYNLYPSMTFSTLLSKHAAPYHIDLITLDIEASEEKAISVFPFDRYKVDVFITEGNMAAGILGRHGYAPVPNRFNEYADWEFCFVKDALLL